MSLKRNLWYTAPSSFGVLLQIQRFSLSIKNYSYLSLSECSQKTKIETSLFSLPPRVLNYLVTFLDPKSAKEFARVSKKCLKSVDLRKRLKFNKELLLKNEEKGKILSFAKRVDPKYLDFSDSLISTDLFLSILECSSNLTKFIIDDFCILKQDGFLKILEKHSNLEYLSLVRCGCFSVKIIQSILNNFPKLKYLNLNQIKVEGISTLQKTEKLPDLLFLNISSTGIKDIDSTHVLSHINLLRTLEL